MVDDPKSCDLACELHTPIRRWLVTICALTPDDPIAGIDGLSIDTIEYERNMIDELALRLVHGELPVGS